jgi:hypothetical protein
MTRRSAGEFNEWASATSALTPDGHERREAIDLKRRV